MASKKFNVAKITKGFTLKLWRGERMCLVAMNVEEPEDDFVGFAIERKDPGADEFQPLMNRLAFEYPEGEEEGVDGSRKFSTLEAPIQKFRWIDFPREVKDGTYSYRVTKMHMASDGVLVQGTSITLELSLDPITHADFLDIGFTRNFASSQAFRDRMGNPENIDEEGKKLLPEIADEGLDFVKPEEPEGIYQWLGFEAYDLLFGILNEAVNDDEVTLDLMAYDLNEAEMVAKLKALGGRLRALIDDSIDETKGTGHGAAGSAETRAAEELAETAGAENVVRTSFSNLQHHKVIILRRAGVPYKVLCGSTNFSYRGLYIQSNNMLVFEDADVAGLFGEVFDSCFVKPKAFRKTELAKRWHTITKEGKPTIHLCFSPHSHPELSLEPLKGAIESASSSVLYAVAFLDQISKNGLTRDAFDRLMERPVFSYGIANKGAKKKSGQGNLEIHKPDGSTGLVDFRYLAENSPEPFKSEWSGGSGINVHHKFVVTDFNLPTARVFTGSSNFAPSGEKNNGDHLIIIEDQGVATAFAIEAIRVFDHLHFRNKMQEADEAARNFVLKLRKPKAISGSKKSWFDAYYVSESLREKDRILFGSK